MPIDKRKTPQLNSGSAAGLRRSDRLGGKNTLSVKFMFFYVEFQSKKQLQTVEKRNEKNNILHYISVLSHSVPVRQRESIATSG